MRIVAGLRVNSHRFNIRPGSRIIRYRPAIRLGPWIIPDDFPVRPGVILHDFAVMRAVMDMMMPPFMPAGRIRRC
jgi:hypothetical protein